MKDDEREFLEQVQKRVDFKDESVFDISIRLRIPYKRARYIVMKWDYKGWYNYGVSWRVGWLTEQGKSIEI